MLIVDFFDIGSLDCSEVMSLFGSPLSAFETVRDEARVLARRVRDGRGSSYHPGWTSRFHWQLSRRPRIIPGLLLKGSLAVNVFLMDPQLDAAKVRELRGLSRRLPNLNIYPFPGAIDEHDAFSFARLYLTRSGDPVGASLFAQKMNVNPDQFDRVPCLGITRFLQSVEDECAVRSGACNILRINAEGAEYGILRAMSSAGYLSTIQLFMGAGHDLRKIDAARYEQYLQFLAQHAITFIEFKASDRAKALRAVRIIEQHVRDLVEGSGGNA
jgi:hypothetical protein